MAASPSSMSSGCAGMGVSLRAGAAYAIFHARFPLIRRAVFHLPGNLSNIGRCNIARTAKERRAPEQENQSSFSRTRLDRESSARKLRRDIGLQQPQSLALVTAKLGLSPKQSSLFLRS